MSDTISTVCCCCIAIILMALVVSVLTPEYNYYIIPVGYENLLLLG